MDAFRIGITRDFLTARGLAPVVEADLSEIGLEGLKSVPGVTLEVFAEDLPEASPRQIAGCDAIITSAPSYTRETFAGFNSRLSIVARVAVGYDKIDIPALTDHDVMLTIAPDGIQRPMATATITLLLALAHQLLPKDRLVREGAWRDRHKFKATGLKGRVFGAVGLGTIGREVLRLLKPFQMVYMAADPFVKPEDVEELGVEVVSLETLMRQSDFLSLHCRLTPETRGLIGERELGWMKPSAYFINAARGGVVDQSALYRALKEGKIRGAGLDVFETEPVPDDAPLLALDNVILSPHSLCWTDECFTGVGSSAARAVLTVLRGEVPPYVVNPEVLERPGMRAKLLANHNRWRLVSGEATV